MRGCVELGVREYEYCNEYEYRVQYLSHTPYLTQLTQIGHINTEHEMNIGLPERLIRTGYTAMR